MCRPPGASELDLADTGGHDPHLGQAVRGVVLAVGRRNQAPGRELFDLGNESLSSR
jgi:hypothetical protein